MSQSNDTYLPSKYAPGGLSLPMNNKRKQTSIIQLSNESRGDTDIDIDIDMEDISNEQQLSTIASYISTERSNDWNTTIKSKNIRNEQPKIKLDLGGIKGELAKDKDFISFIQKINQGVEIVNHNPVYLIIDTNFIISHLHLLNDLRQLSIENNLIIKMILPNMVIEELDGLKKSTQLSNNSGDNGVSYQDLGKLARNAIDWYYTLLHNMDPVVKVQKLSERVDISTTKDNAILDCCLYFSKKFSDSLVILLSDDKNFCTKAFAEDLLTISYKSYMTSRIVFYRIIYENNERKNQYSLSNEYEYDLGDTEDMMVDTVYRDTKNNKTNLTEQTDLSVLYTNEDEITQVDETATAEDDKEDIIAAKERMPFKEAAQLVYELTEKLSLEAIEHTLQAEYGEDAELLNYKLDNLRDCCEILIRFKISVFSKYFKSSKTRGFDPFRELTGNINSNKLKNRELYCVPNSFMEAMEFTKFWQTFLSVLYANRSTKEIDALEKVFHYFQNILN